MKIAIVHPGQGFDTLKPSSFCTIICELATVQQKDTQTRIFAGWTPSPDARFDLNLLPPPSTRIYKSEAALFADRIRKFCPDLIEVHFNSMTAARIASALPDIPVVFYRHLGDVPYPRLKHLRRSWRYCWPAHIISVSHFIHRASVALRPETASRSSVIHNTLAANPWLSQECDKENIILFCGRAIQIKGIEPFIQAVGDILPNHPDWRAVVLSALSINKDNPAASSSAQDYAQQQEARFKQAVGDKGEWITNAPRAQVQTWTKKARIAVVPSNWDDPFPTTLLEQHMAGCAVISSGRGGMKEVSGPDGALYLKEVSGDAIAEALRFLINNTQERTALARRGHEYVMRHHNIQDRAAELDALRHQIVQRAQQERRTPKIWRRHVRREQLRTLKAKLFG